MKKKTLPILITLIIIYFVLKYLIPFGNYVIYPINLLVTFMHEFGHAFFALITGGSIVSLEVNSDGSGLLTSSGGWRFLVLMGGYIGSAIFGNILLRIGLQDKKNISEKILYLLSGLIVFVAIFWFSGIVSTLILFVLALGLAGLAKYTNYDKIILQFLGVASLLFIIEDFNVGPSSDLSKFTEIFIIIPQSGWMIIWLILVLMITFFNLKTIFNKKIQ
ncbi:M50 family metallopeptidase [Candidatus Gracilibacteria bacterium]|nr:M50 family metallopeptidase [Candidatus Gracilibacteria bacterium]